MPITQEVREELLGYQRAEVTKYHIYRRLAQTIKAPENRQIAVFNYYIAIAKDEPFKRRFVEMAGLGLGVAAPSSVVGLIVREVFGVET